MREGGRGKGREGGGKGGREGEREGGRGALEIRTQRGGLIREEGSLDKRAHCRAGAY